MLKIHKKWLFILSFFLTTIASMYVPDGGGQLTGYPELVMNISSIIFFWFIIRLFYDSVLWCNHYNQPILNTYTCLPQTLSTDKPKRDTCLGCMYNIHHHPYIDNRELMCNCCRIDDQGYLTMYDLY